MRGLSVALLVIGLILLVYGLNAGDSFASNVKEAFTGTPTDRSIWLVVSGALLAIIGGTTLLMRARNTA